MIAVFQGGNSIFHVQTAPKSFAWDDRLHGLRIQVPPTVVTLPPGSTVVVQWWLGGTCNGNGPWLSGAVVNPNLVRGPDGLVFNKVRTMLTKTSVLAERPLGVIPAAIQPRSLVLPIESGPVTCLVLDAKPAPSASATTALPGLIIALGMGVGGDCECRSGLALWWSGAARAGWTVAAP